VKGKEVSMENTVKVAIFGSDEPIRIVEAGLLGQVIERALGTSTVQGYTVRVNGESVDHDTPVREGSLVTLVPEVKAG
jgi:molybdopterin converting factor small subunit